MRKLEFKTLFQKISCADCILVFKVHDIACLSVFVFEREVVWSPVCLLWSICVESVPGSRSEAALRQLWQAGSLPQNAESLIQKGGNSPAAACVYLSAVEERAPASEEPSAPLHSAPLPPAVQGTHNHHSCTLQALYPAQNITLSGERWRSENSD